MPAEVGVYDVKKVTSIGYDTSVTDDIVKAFGIENDKDLSNKRKASY